MMRRDGRGLAGWIKAGGMKIAGDDPPAIAPRVAVIGRHDRATLDCRPMIHNVVGMARRALSEWHEATDIGPRAEEANAKRHCRQNATVAKHHCRRTTSSPATASKSSVTEEAVTSPSRAASPDAHASREQRTRAAHGASHDGAPHPGGATHLPDANHHGAAARKRM